jgi:hypothetical protein
MSLRARADYTVTLLSDQLPARTVKTGQGFDLDVSLTSNAPSADQHWSAVLRVEFSASGLRLDGYDWSLPFVTGGADDVSMPALANLPAVIRAGSVPDALGGSGRVDMFLSNFTASEQGYRVGNILRLRMAVPADYVGADRIRIQVVPESLGNGFSVIPTKAGEPFWLRIVPSEGQARPSLSVAIDNGLVSLTWPASIQGATLQTTNDLTGEWVDLPEVPEIVEGQNRVSLFTNTGSRPAFFRLRFP